jgi:HD superfamily phosphohydrolase
VAQPVNNRTYLDPIHHEITLDRDKPEEELIVQLIDTPEFQRLRRIQQLGVSYFTFQGAEGSRFTHSVGVMHVARKLLNQLGHRDPSILEKKALVLASALLHDLGHGPFSHCTEKIVGYNHEDWSCRIISGDTKVKAVLDKYKQHPHLAEDIVRVLHKQYQPKFVSHLISSQLDCDRFDYLLRDSYMTGTEYGLFALQRVLSSLEVDEGQNQVIVSGEKGQTAVEHYLFARYSMHRLVYYHKKNLAARVLLTKLMKRARHAIDQGQCFFDEPTRKWLTGEDLDVSEYLFLDDVQLTYHVKKWAQAQDKILADLASRFLTRRLFKAMKIPQNGGRSLKEIEDKAAKLAAASGFDPDYYVATESSEFRPYDYYRPDSKIPQTNIMVRTDTGKIVELSQLSMTIEALVKGDYHSDWLVYPAEIADKLSSVKELVPSPG